MISANPILSREMIIEPDWEARRRPALSVDATIFKALFFLALAFMATAMTWGAGGFDDTGVLGLILGGIFGLLVASFAHLSEWAALIIGTVVSLIEGAIIGAVATVFGREGYDAFIQVMLIPYGTLLLILLGRLSRVMAAGDRLELFICAAIGSFLIPYLYVAIFSLFGENIPYLHESGLIAPIIGLIVATVASLVFVTDASVIDEMVEDRQPREMEWAAAFGLAISLIGFYIFVFAMMSKRRRRENDEF